MGVPYARSTDNPWLYLSVWALPVTSHAIKKGHNCQDCCCDCLYWIRVGAVIVYIETLVRTVRISMTLHFTVFVTEWLNEHHSSSLDKLGILRGILGNTRKGQG